MVIANQSQVEAAEAPDPGRPWILRLGTGHSNPTAKLTGRTAQDRWPLLVAEFDADKAEWERLKPPLTTNNDDDQDEG